MKLLNFAMVEMQQIRLLSQRKTFEEGSIGQDLPFIIINKNDLEDGVWVIEAMRKLALIQSNGEGRRLIANGELE